jgi:hypothetical protein
VSEEKQLKIFECGGDTVIAYDAEDAAKVWEETTGETWWADDGEWRESIRDDDITIWFDDRPKTIPRAAKVEEPSIANDDRFLVTASAEAWIQASGRGFLCTENF